MPGARQTADAARTAVGDALAKGRRKVGGGHARPAVGPRALMAMQRAAGNSAVNALMAARLRWPGDQARSDIDGGLRELRKDEPNVDTLEKGLKAAKNLGIPVDLEGVRPPASALAVTTTGFGPGQVAPKKAVPPKKPVPAKSPLGKAAAKPAKPVGGGPGAAPPAPQISGGEAPVAEPATLSGEQLLQPPVKPPGVKPESDPAFTKVTRNVTAFGKAKRAHPPAASKAKEAQDAALAPSDDLGGQAKAAKADNMDAQQAGTFDKKAFIAAVKAAIEAKSPKTLKEADSYKESGKAGEVKGEIKGMVTQGKEGQAKDIEAATEAAPDQSKAVPKPVTPMGPEPPGSAVPIPAAGAVPKPAPPEQLNLEAGKHEVNQEMAEGEVTEEQLAQSNEPQFQQGLADRQAAAEHADKAPGEYRQQEQQVIEQGKADANAETKEGVAGMQGAKGAALAKVIADKGKTKSRDEQKRAEVTARIQAIFDATEADVRKILDGIDPKVEKEFEDGEKSARATFESYVSAKMSAYKKDRYGGWTGKFRWLRDKIRGMPDKVNEFYVAGRELYLKQMDVTIARVADIVGGDLMAAKRRIAAGKTEISTYVKSLPNNLKKIGSEASKEIGDRFEQLESDVTSKQESVVDTLATKYVAARKGLDERIEELQAENRGLIDKAIGAIKAIINTIRELVAMLKNVLARVAGVVGQIVAHPIRFLGNLIDGIKGGINRFKENFLAHLRKGLLSWLFGALAEGGVELPETFDLKGVIKLLASLFGLTWRNIRDRIVKQIGEKAMSAVETGVDIFQKLAAGGVGALWEMLLEKLGDIKEMILDQVKDFVLTKIITAGITWLISLLNPAAAFIKACKLIYDVVMFFVNNASRIAKFVNTILDSVSDIVRGNISGVVAKIEDVLSQMVPIIIGFLASVIGLGGIGQKIREIVQKLQKPVNKALDFVIKTGLKLAGPVIRGIAGIAGKVKGKIAAGKAWVKGKVAAGKQWVKGKARAIGEALGIIKRPFNAGERRHMLSVDTRTGAIVMASTPRPVLEAILHEIRVINDRRRAAGLAPLDSDALLRNVAQQIVLARQAIASQKIGRDAAARQQLDLLVPVIVELLSQIGADVTTVPIGGAPGIGRIAPHSENSGAVPRNPAQPWVALESEHVIPVSLVSDLFNSVGESRRIDRPGPEDNLFHTILVYKGAASAKTHGIESGGQKYGLADSDAITWATAVRTRGAPNLGGRSRIALGHRELPVPERSERESLWQGLTAAQRIEVLRHLLADRMAERVVDLNASIAEDHRRNGQRRGESQPTPDPATVRAAAAIQVRDIISIFGERLG
ncbi:phage tail protein [Nocardioides guangzhouensis]|uniref:phage tail protein n=1 Tax=Nocardioides guangzhouensis TaxID=2497878 RepID=UPI00158CF3B8|nr:hypothetical protein [Nocardioides guangzhouensis]